MTIFIRRCLILNYLIVRYTTVDKVDDDKDRDAESQAKKAKVNKSEDDGISILFCSHLDAYKTWKRPEERFISFYVNSTVFLYPLQ